MVEPSQLGKALSVALSNGPSRTTLLSQRDAMVAAMQASAPSRAVFTVRWPALAVVGSLLALVVGWRLWLSTPTGVLHASHQGRELAEQARVVATAPAGEALEFSDGSRLVLNHRAEIAVSRLSREQAQVQLNNGTVSARIQKGTGRVWAIDAGPYSIRVLGTEFSVDWNREQEEIRVNVSEGQVLVGGSDLPAAGIMLSAGGRWVRRSKADGSRPIAAAPPSADPLPAISAAAPAPASVPAPAEPSWRSAAEAGSYAEALRGAERLGFDQLVKTLPEKDVLLLANTARYAGSLGRARQALITLRERFAGGPSAPVAALLLAGLAEDHAKNSDEAATWLRVFLKEAPQGELSAGARARLLAILVRQGKQPEASRIAADYLRYHPRGPYAGKARDVLDASSSR